MIVHTWEELVDVLLARKIAFISAFFVVFLLSYALLSWLDFLPEPVTSPEVVKNEKVNELAAVGASVVPDIIEEATSTQEVVMPKTPLFPDTIIFDSLDRTVAVLNPTSRGIADLDAALLYGVVRHPDSATLEQPGTVFILGHSSYLPTVLNQNFQAFNGIQNLRFGDTIRLQAENKEYVYRVEKVYRAQAGDVTVPIAGAKQRLVLATCNSFGAKDDRYIVEAELLETKTLPL
jgi:LPXTG-site transpeptidase (sortase) family protein